MRTIAVVLFFAVAGCTPRPEFVGTREDKVWMSRALSHPNANSAYSRFARAYRGDAEALHAYFAEALRQAESPEINVEAGESLSIELENVIAHIGDAPFAAALSREPQRTRSAMASCFADIASPNYPATKRVLDAAPKIDFPMLKTERGDYRPKSPSS